MPDQRPLDRTAAVLLVVLCAIWGVQQVSVKIANAGISPLLQAGVRSIGALLLVLAWSRWRGVKIMTKDGSLIAGIGAGLLFALEFALLFWALKYTTASRGVIFLYTAPFFVALGAAWVLPQERLRPAQWLGMVLAFLGILVLFGEHLLVPAGGAWIGDLMMMAAGATWGATTVLIKTSCLARIEPERTLLYQLAVSALLLPLLSIAVGESGVMQLTPAVVAALLFQTLVVASSSYLAWFWLIRRYPATRLSAFSFLTPLFGVIAGGIVLGERLTLAVALALVLVGCGIWLTNLAPRRA